MNFASVESLDVVSVFGEDTIMRVFGGPIPRAIFLFINNDKNNTNIIEIFDQAAKYNIEEGNKTISFLLTFIRTFQRKNNISEILCRRPTI